jgi:hypothetical protein
MHFTLQNRFYLRITDSSVVFEGVFHLFHYVNYFIHTDEAGLQLVFHDTSEFIFPQVFSPGNTATRTELWQVPHQS